MAEVRGRDPVIDGTDTGGMRAPVPAIQGETGSLRGLPVSDSIMTEKLKPMLRHRILAKKSVF